MPETMMRFELTAQEFNTVLAALRWYEFSEMGEPENRPLWLHEIACGDRAGQEEQVSLNDEAVDALAERLNCDSPW